MNRDAIPAISAIAGLILGLTAGVVHGNVTDDDRTDAEVTRDLLDNGSDAANALAEMPSTDPCILLFGDEIAKDFGIKNPGNGKSHKDVTFKTRTCSFNNGLQVTLWQEPQYTRVVYRDQRDFGRVFITDHAASTTDFPLANEGTLYYDGKLLYEGLFRTEYGTTVSIQLCNGGFSGQQLQKVAARVLDRLTGV